MYILWISAARAVFVTACQGAIFSILTGFIILTQGAYLIVNSNAMPSTSLLGKDFIVSDNGNYKH